MKKTKKSKTFKEALNVILKLLKDDPKSIIFFIGCIIYIVSLAMIISFVPMIVELFVGMLQLFSSNLNELVSIENPTTVLVFLFAGLYITFKLVDVFIRLIDWLINKSFEMMKEIKGGNNR